MPSDTPTPAEIAAAHHIRSYQYPAVLCGCGQEPELDNPPKVDFFAGAELLRARHAAHVIAALSEHYHLLPKAEVQGPNASGDYTIPVKTRRPQDNPHIRIEPVNPWGERVMYPLAVPQPFRDPDLARGFAAALASAADVAEEKP